MNPRVIYLLLIVLTGITGCIRHPAAKTVQQRSMVGPDTLEPYGDDTLLKGGYAISFRTDDSIEHLFLKKGPFEKEISSFGRGSNYNLLGYKIADFDRYFVLAHSSGSGNPVEIELIRKIDGRNVLEEGACWLGANEAEEVLLYARLDSPLTNKLTLLDVRTDTKHFLPPLPGCEDCPVWMVDIDTLQVTAGGLDVVYELSEGGKRRLRYHLTANPAASGATRKN